MIHLSDGILLVLEYGLAVFCFVDIVRSPEAAVPWVPRWGWIIAVLVFPLAGTWARNDGFDTAPSLDEVLAALRRRFGPGHSLVTQVADGSRAVVDIEVPSA